MNEDIKQLIEKECEAQKDIHWNDFGERADSASRLFDEAFAKGFNSCLSKWQEAERWRKVEEELPPISEKPILGKYILKSGEVILRIMRYDGNWKSSQLNCISFPDEWKPIND